MNNKEIWEKIKYAVYSWEIINLDNWKKYIYLELVLIIMYEEEDNKFLNLNLIIAGIS